MLRGILYRRSVDINFAQKIIDPLFLSIISFIIFDKTSAILNFNYLVIFLLNLSILNFNKLYESYRIKSLCSLFPNLLLTSALSSLVNLFFFKYQPSSSNYELKLFFCLSFLYLFFFHFLIRSFLRYLRTKGMNKRNVVFFGNKNSFNKLIDNFKKYPWIGYSVIYWYSPNIKDHENNEGNNKPIICSGGLNDLIQKIKFENIDKLLFSYNSSDDLNFEEIVKKIGDTCISASFLFTDFIPLSSFKKEYYGEFAALNIWNPSSFFIGQKIKRIFDLSAGIIIFIILLPLFLFITISIKFTSKGPIIFKQKRYGLNGKVFEIFKFRSMYERKEEECSELFQATKNDLRITKIGKFLRKYSLDELPQLINVIKGEMSLVGPRPHAVQHNEFYRKLITGYMQRHSKLPGMTGLAQINGARGETPNIEMMRRRVQFDIDYNNNWSLITDFEILIKTFFSILTGKSY